MTTSKATLDVEYVGKNKGNVGETKQYKYTYHPSSIKLEPKDTEILITLTKKTPIEIKVTGSQKTTSSQDSWVADKGRNITIPSPYKKGQSYWLTIFVYDSKRECDLKCDPQVHNSPPPLWSS